MNAAIGMVGMVLAMKGQGVTTVSLDEAIRSSEAHSNAVKIAQSEYDAAKARIGENRARKQPHVDFNASVSHFDDRTVVSFPGSASKFELAPNNQEQLGLVISQDFDVSGEIGMSIGQARLQALAAAYRLRTASEDQELTTTIAYYAVLRGEQNVRVAKASLQAYTEQSTIADRLYKGGVGQKIDVLRAQTQVAEAEREVVRRQNELDSARSTLNDLMSRPLDAPISLVDPASAPTANGTDTHNREALISEAIDKRPEALAASVDVQAAQKGVSIARTGMSPSVLLSLSGTRYPTTSFSQPRQNVAALTLSVGVPLYDGGLTKARVQEAKTGVDAAKARQDQTRRDISLQVQNAALDVDTEHKRLEAANVALTSATAARKLAQQRFESQVGLYIEVTDAQSELTAAQAAQVEATYDLLTAKARLARALSQPLSQ